MNIESGAKATVETFKVNGVNLVLGITGHTVMELADELYKDGTIRTIYPRVETAGSYMIYGFNRILGEPKSVGIWHVAGMPHVAPGVMTAYIDSIPMVCIGANSWSQYRGRPAFQDTPTYEMYAPISKWACRVERTEQLPEVLNKAFLISKTGRPGPCILDVPFDRFVDKAEFGVPNKTEIPIPPAGSDEAIRRACELLLNATSPIILAGGGVVMSEASKELQKLAEMLCIPVATGFASGKGAISEDHPLALGVSGFLGWKTANDYLSESDCWCAIGFSFSQIAMQEWTVQTPDNIIQIDIDASQIGRAYTPSIGIVGDAKTVIGQMIRYLEKKVQKEDYTNKAKFQVLKKRRDEWLAQLDEQLQSDAKPISPYRVMKEIRAILPSNGIVTVDSGNNLEFGIHALKALEPKTILASQKYSAVGGGFPMALGVKLAKPDRQVISLTGDGAFHYFCSELATAMMEKIPVTVVILNNGYLNANRMIADFLFEGRRVWVKLNNPDFVMLSKSFGAEAERVESPAEISRALRRGQASDIPYVIDIVIDDTVLPPVTKPWKIRW